MQSNHWRYRLIAEKLRMGAVIAYPTEGVWGLGCLPEYEASVAKILSLKGRAWQKGLIMAAATLEQALPYVADLKPDEIERLEQLWPGPTTVVMPKSDRTPLWVSGQFASVAIRVSAHPVIQGICRAVQQPIISTSANPSGKDPALNHLRVRQYFGQQVDVVVPGELGGQSGPSQIITLRDQTVIREGGA
jgi:L-threonylcarbamoyladenylate synthase